MKATKKASRSLHTTEVEITIPFHDVDSMGITWHGNYLRYFEIARCQLLDEIGYGYRQMQASPYSWPIVDLQVKYVQSSIFEQKIKVIASLVEWEHRLRINYQVRDAHTNQRLTKGYTIQAAVDDNTRELCFVTPDEFRRKIAPLLPADAREQLITDAEPSAGKEPSANEEPSTNKQPSSSKKPSANEEPATNKQPSASKEGL